MLDSSRQFLAWLCMLCVLMAGMANAAIETEHSGHADTAAHLEEPSGDETSGDQDEHCCHMAGHVLGVATDSLHAEKPCLAGPCLTTPDLRLNPGQAPPTPPPTR